MNESIYRSICESNRALYTELENLTHLVNFCMVHKNEDGFIEFSNQKEAIRALIEINLDRLSDYWEIFDTRARKAERSESYQLMTGREKRIIDDYKQIPDITMQQLGDKHNISLQAASRIITNYLTKKYNQVA